MATRFYLQNRATQFVPAFDGSWEVSSTAVRRAMSPVQRYSPFLEVSQPETLAGTTTDGLNCQFISDPIQAQTITGTVKAIVRARQNAADADMRAQLLIRVLSYSLATVRGTMLAHNAGALASEYALGLTNRKFPLAWGAPVAVTSVAALAGDRIVVEMGYRSHNALTASRTGYIEIGDAAGSDLAEDEISTSQLNPWIEFSHNVSFVDVADRRRGHDNLRNSPLGSGLPPLQSRTFSFSTFGAAATERPETRSILREVDPNFIRGLKLLEAPEFRSVLRPRESVGLGGGGVPLDSILPTVTNLVPAPASSILRTDDLAFDVTDNVGFARIIVQAQFSTGYVEVVHDGLSFKTPYTGTLTPLINGFSYTNIVRTGFGWPTAGLTLRIFAIDSAGNQSTPTDFAYTVTNPLNPVTAVPDLTPPVVSNIVPAPLSSILRTAALAFNATDDSSAFAAIVVQAEFDTGVVEVIHDGTSFQGLYSGTKAPIAGGFSYTNLVRSGVGWPTAGLILRVLAVDEAGNQSTPTDFSYTVTNPLSSTTVVEYFKMRGRDQVCLVQPAYVYWIVTGAPDLTAAFLNPIDLPCGTVPATDVIDIHVAGTWRDDA